LQRLTRDLSALVKDPIPGIFALPDPSNLLQVIMPIIAADFSLTPAPVAFCNHRPSRIPI
jgi:hypothetical protein